MIAPSFYRIRPSRLAFIGVTAAPHQNPPRSIQSKSSRQEQRNKHLLSAFQAQLFISKRKRSGYIPFVLRRSRLLSGPPCATAACRSQRHSSNNNKRSVGRDSENWSRGKGRRTHPIHGHRSTLESQLKEVMRQTLRWPSLLRPRHLPLAHPGLDLAQGLAATATPPMKHHQT